MQEDEERVSLAIIKMEDSVSAIIETEKTKRRVSRWEPFKVMLNEMFVVPIEPGRVMREISAGFYYDLQQEPREFANRIKVVYSSVPASGLPNMDQAIKRKLYDGLTTTLKENLRFFMEDQLISLNAFLKELDDQRRIHLQVTRNEKKIREIKEETNLINKVETTPETTQDNSWLINLSSTIGSEMSKGQEVLIKAIEEMGKKVEANSARPPRKKYCGYCRTDQHWIYECPKNPPRGSCFDCLIVGHRRGDPGCPKKQQ